VEDSLHVHSFLLRNPHYLPQSLHNFLVPLTHLLISEVGFSLVLSKLSHFSQNPQELFVVDVIFQIVCVALDNGKHLCGSQNGPSDFEEAVHEVFPFQEALVVLVQILEGGLQLELEILC
jgi:hypothetical protein